MREFKQLVEAYAVIGKRERGESDCAIIEEIMHRFVNEVNGSGEREPVLEWLLSVCEQESTKPIVLNLIYSTLRPRRHGVPKVLRKQFRQAFRRRKKEIGNLPSRALKRWTKTKRK